MDRRSFLSMLAGILPAALLAKVMPSGKASDLAPAGRYVLDACYHSRSGGIVLIYSDGTLGLMQGPMSSDSKAKWDELSERTKREAAVASFKKLMGGS